MRMLSKIAAYAVFAALLGFFSAAPAIRVLPEQMAVISISFSHSGQRIGSCTRLSQEELLKLPPNMRTADECPRQRHPVHVQLTIDEDRRIDIVASPSGLWQDGKSVVYKRVSVPAGAHKIRIRMNDSGPEGLFQYTEETTVYLVPQQHIVVTFDSSNARIRILPEQS